MDLEVTYEDGEPVEIEFFSMTAGMMKFRMEGSSAVAIEKWNELTHVGLADKYEPQVKTEDVVEAVQDLPFVQAVEHPVIA